MAEGRPPSRQETHIGPISNRPTNTPAPQEQGWRDSFIALPKMVNRIIATYTLAPPGPDIDRTGTTFPANYIHHCHILEHEDNDMMRPWQLTS